MIKICIEKNLIPPEERAEDNRVYGAFYNGVLPAEEIEGIRKVFNFYVKFPKERWLEIKKAETDNNLFKVLQQEFNEKNLLNKEYTTYTGFFEDATTNSLTRRGYPGAGRSLFLSVVYEY